MGGGGERTAPVSGGYEPARTRGKNPLVFKVPVSAFLVKNAPSEPLKGVRISK